MKFSDKKRKEIYIMYIGEKLNSKNRITLFQEKKK